MTQERISKTKRKEDFETGVWGVVTIVAVLPPLNRLSGRIVEQS
jgi:hypothetical protein